MNYNKLYSRFIESRPARKKVRGDGLETHHIIPRCCGGNNNKENLIVLKPREHFIAHIMLIRCYSGAKKHKLMIALNNMMRRNGTRYGYFTSRRYQIVRSRATESFKKLIIKLHQNKEWALKAKINSTKAKQTPEYRKRMSKIIFEKYKTDDEYRKKCYQVTQNTKRRFAIKEAKLRLWNDINWRKSQLKICPHCQKEINKSNFMKWHGDRCLNNPNSNFDRSMTILQKQKISNTLKKTWASSRARWGYQSNNRI